MKATFLRFVVFGILLVSSPIFGAECRLLSSDIQENLALSWQEFDQTMGKGHRKFSLKGCFIEASTLIDVYHFHNERKIDASQSRILYFHSGQMYAYSELNAIAAGRMEKSVNPDEHPRPELNWNDYVRASVSFLKGDLENLKKNRDRLAAGRATDGNKLNLSVVDRLIQCFGKPYAYAFDQIERCQK